jgi:hypothetical protein
MLPHAGTPCLKLGLLLRGKLCFFLGSGALTRFFPISPLRSAYGPDAQYPRRRRGPRPQFPHMAHLSG